MALTEETAYAADEVEAFRERVAAWARRADVPEPTVEITSKGVVCIVVGSADGVRLMASPTLVAAASEIQDSVLAHEFAHIVLGHVSTEPKRSVPTVITSNVGLAAIAVSVVAFVIGANAVAAGGAALVVVCMIVLGCLLRPARRRELAADRVAADRFGRPFDRTLAAWLKTAGGHDPGIGWDLLSTHPSHRRRHRAARST